MTKAREKQLSKFQCRVPHNSQENVRLAGVRNSDDTGTVDFKNQSLVNYSHSTATSPMSRFQEAAKKSPHFYQTHAVYLKQLDESDESEQLRQSDTIRKILAARQASAARERLKKKDAVLTKKGRKLFDEFMREANAYRPSKCQSILTMRKTEDLRNLYNAASALDFNNWLVFVNDFFKGQI
jgi:glutamate synthase domain-containing protein 2